MFAFVRYRVRPRWIDYDRTIMACLLLQSRMAVIPICPPTAGSEIRK